MALFFIPLIAISCGVLGIIISFIGIKDVQREPQTKTGQGMGVAGLVTGILGYIGGVVMAMVYLTS